MAVKKEGDLRVRKGGSIYGPMTRADFDRLLANGRFTVADFVSVRDGPWMEVYGFLAPQEESVEPTAAGALRVLHGEHVFNSLSHEEVSQLRRDRRISNEDLVCAVGGPWMSVADFLAPPRPLESWAGELAEAEVLDDDDLAEAEVVDDDEVVEAEYVPTTWYHAYAGAIEEQLSDQWFVRVRGIHSAPLTRQQVRQLVFAREITDNNVARHVTWGENSWQPIYAIPELAIAGEGYRPR